MLLWLLLLLRISIGRWRRPAGSFSGIDSWRREYIQEKWTYRGESTRESLEEAVDSCAKAWLGVWATVTVGEDALVAVEGDEDGACCCFFLEKKDIERKTELKVILYGCDGVRKGVFILFIFTHQITN
jgi:hypothetical protein